MSTQKRAPTKTNVDRVSNMAFTNDLARFETGLVQRMRATFNETRRIYMQRRQYNETYNELNKLTDRELDDLGIARGNIATVAREAAGQV